MLQHQVSHNIPPVVKYPTSIDSTILYLTLPLTHILTLRAFNPARANVKTAKKSNSLLIYVTHLKVVDLALLDEGKGLFIFVGCSLDESEPARDGEIVAFQLVALLSIVSKYLVRKRKTQSLCTIDETIHPSSQPFISFSVHTH